MQDYLTIREVSLRLGVSVDTLRRWDRKGYFPAIKKGPRGHRFYPKQQVDAYMRDIFAEAKKWVMGELSLQNIPQDQYCENSGIFQMRSARFQQELASRKELEKIYPLILAVVGEIGNNSFDHNLGNWPEDVGIFFAHDLVRGYVVLADKGQGILKTLKRIRPDLASHEDALRVAFTEVITGRSPENRGNGLKFVKKVVQAEHMELFFYSGDAVVQIKTAQADIKIASSSFEFRGCLAFLKFYMDTQV
ncbi:MAG: hypothetical protein A3H59_03300 [Candidatus Jacksonbacteria bacterium RIFCSPLOWO2_02_FULL_43_9]|nr:MAG: hypothetical protein UV70_C0010G0029 [Parcubacteria group bacterium GW2011_GWA2_43_13]OGY68464.1 MAG: hypothetical protein A3B94_02815 [Candidatus Jacksonbacteria bacterium RIFCSPHIGHO2_02_FULL_43_10]OGY70727.1 MAG: hypothetical protein A2986_03075 [Candidatus Jacksonbacteria bacterium RIFCSPLOWO2_01_FULL_44_13]OGY72213.1 MAG: hypothetical protein A3H59_03300 [Candidatus Jacksonbacteria bacterium RIFCSPLOWO2_02_FULL_43_9]HAZ16678.1 hypothetical protein [Candidatus Jacksonbacteria bacter